MHGAFQGRHRRRHFQGVEARIGTDLAEQVDVHVHQAGQDEFVRQVDEQRIVADGRGIDEAGLYPRDPLALDDDRPFTERRIAGYGKQGTGVDDRRLSGGRDGQCRSQQRNNRA